MADTPDGFIIDPRDWPDVADMIRWWRLQKAAGGPAAEPDSAPSTLYYGKLAQDVAEGPLEAPDNVVSVRIGPAWGGDDRDTEQIPADYSWSAGSEGDWVRVRRKRSKWYIEPFSGGVGAEITFQIDDMVENVTIGEQEYRAGWCKVIAKSCDSDIQGADEEGRVLVIDVLGCLFNEPDEDLEPTEDHDGRMGVASWQELIDDPDHECRYVATALCCPPPLV